MLCSTSLLEAGVSIKNQVKFLFLVDCKEYQKAIQIINRPRINSEQGINTVLDVALFRSMHSEKNIKLRKFITAEVYFHKSKIICRGLNNNNLNVDSERKKIHHDMNFDALFYESEHKFKINPLGILHEIYKAENSCNLETMLKRMVRFDDRINLKKAEVVTNAEIEEVKKIRANLLENEKFNKEYLNRLLDDDSTRYDAINSIIFLSKNMELKKESQIVHDVKIIDKFNCIDFIERHKQAFAGTSPSKVLKNINFLMKSDIKKNMSSKEAVEILKNTEEAELRLSKNRIIAQERQKKLLKNPEQLHIIDRINADINNRIISRIVDCDKKKRKNQEYCWTAEQFQRIINKCRKKHSENSNFKPITNNGGLGLIRTFFQVISKTKRVEGKAIKFYKIVRKVKAKNIAKKLAKNS